MANASTNQGTDDEERWSSAEQAKNELEAEILRCPSRKRIVVAGPGTGKTSLFKQILEGEKKDAITLTFINSLVEDLSLELFGLSEVRTLHGYARSIISTTRQRNVPIYPHLSGAIDEDINILEGKIVDFDSIFERMDDQHPDLSFYKKRKEWYSHFGFTDLIYSVVKYFQLFENRIPEYEIVLVDEFQDFNDLEVTLIELLARKSPILLAGDDDQALYDELKGASTAHIRKRFFESEYGYKPFTLHHCRRCTRVIIDAANDILREATKRGFLEGRIKKEFKYLDRQEKDKDCQKYSHITNIKGQPGQIAFLICEEIKKIAEEKKDKFEILVLCPKTLHSKLAQRFRKQGFSNLLIDEDQEESQLSKLIGGLNKIADAEKGISNLGWRIICKHILNKEEFEKLIKSIGTEPQNNFQDYLNPSLRKKITKLVSIFKKIRGPKVPRKRNPPKGESRADLEMFFADLKIDAFDLGRSYIKKQALDKSHEFAASGVRSLPIRISTITKSKGLSYDYVFIAHIDDKYYLEQQGVISDKKICNFLVALTRARKKVYLLSHTGSEPTFIKWIDAERIETIEAMMRD